MDNTTETRLFATSIEDRLVAIEDQLDEYGKLLREGDACERSGHTPVSVAIKTNDQSRMTNPVHIDKISNSTWRSAVQSNISKVLGYRNRSMGDNEMALEIDINGDYINLLYPDTNDEPSRISAYHEEFQKKYFESLREKAIKLTTANEMIHYVFTINPDTLVARSIDAIFTINNDRNPIKTAISRNIWETSTRRNLIGAEQSFLHAPHDTEISNITPNENTQSIVKTDEIKLSLSSNDLEQLILDRASTSTRLRNEALIRTNQFTLPIERMQELLQGQKEHFSSVNKYEARRRKDLTRVIEDQSNLTDDEWSTKGDILPALYPSKYDGISNISKFKLIDKDLGFVSIGEPIKVNLWVSKNGQSTIPPETTLFPTEATFDKTVKEAYERAAAKISQTSSSA
ncbi:uncharacterized protein L201_003923 [Kwoniella dendrophila CBS 6074]|uniref:Uncharacterized protein n=1 Tax=Kwoniella dendrophila CBS 6074 TaxID=1295534 RepID=A0AAX4JU93_9TREE